MDAVTWSVAVTSSAMASGISEADMVEFGNTDVEVRVWIKLAQLELSMDASSSRCNGK